MIESHNTPAITPVTQEIKPVILRISETYNGDEVYEQCVNVHVMCEFYREAKWEGNTLSCVVHKETPEILFMMKKRDKMSPVAIFFIGASQQKIIWNYTDCPVFSDMELSLSWMDCFGSSYWLEQAEL